MCPASAQRSDSKDPNSDSAGVLQTYGQLPLTFEANQGQSDSQVKFLSRGSGYTLFLTPTEAVLALRNSPPPETKPGTIGALPRLDADANQQDTLRIRLLGSNPEPRLMGLDELPGKSNYFIGKRPERWRTSIPSIPRYGRIRYEEVYTGIDLVYYGSQGRLEYDFIVAPGSDPRDVRLVIYGAEQLDLDDKGNLLLGTRGGRIVQHAPFIYQETEGVKKAISGGYVLHPLPEGERPSAGKYLVGFSVGKYDASIPLVIDPVLEYSTYLGGSGEDGGLGIAVDSGCNSYIIGATGSTNFPMASPFQPAYAGGLTDVFVAKLNSTGSALAYATYLGGSGEDEGSGIAVGPDGSAYITGFTRSLDFPTANPRQASHAGGNSDVFVAKLNPAGSVLEYSTYLGGSSQDEDPDIAVDSDGNAYITGFTRSLDFPTANPFQANYAGGDSDAFVAKLDPTGSDLAYSTYFGGSDPDFGRGIAVDASTGEAYVTGFTLSPDFPTAHPLQATHGGGIRDAFVTKFNAAESALLYSTHLGGSDWDVGDAIAVDASGKAYVTGYTVSNNFPIVSAFQADSAGLVDAFVTKINADGSALIYSTYLGSSGVDFGRGIAVDSHGNAYVVGYTGSPDFPMIRALQTTRRGNTDAFIAKLNAAGSSLVYSTYLGGSSSDAGHSIAVDALGNAYVTGETRSLDFPTANPLRAANGGNSDLFVAKITVVAGSQGDFSR